LAAGAKAAAEATRATRQKAVFMVAGPGYCDDSPCSPTSVYADEPRTRGPSGLRIFAAQTHKTFVAFESGRLRSCEGSREGLTAWRGSWFARGRVLMDNKQWLVDCGLWSWYFAIYTLESTCCASCITVWTWHYPWHQVLPLDTGVGFDSGAATICINLSVHDDQKTIIRCV
jgi:hypothetical protein